MTRDLVLLVFLLTQYLDGVLTYIGVTTYGVAVEANPIVATLMVHIGEGTALILTKTVAAGLGILLHLHRVHGAVAMLAVFYLAVAVAPWTAILLIDS